ncbi:MAG: signal peptide peptidase SppA [Chloroflexi bacterium]|nr:signal peptide peptidase SppA [Chloroflexota bacterium]
MVSEREAMRLPRLRPVIGVVELHGMIGAGVRASTLFYLLDQVERSPRIGAVLLDIDSPGGGAAASEDIYFKVMRLRKKKPVVAYIRGMGASGGYMAACAASKIVALPGSLVGSIGVISMRPVLVQLMERLGVGVSINKSSPLKDMGAFYRPSTPDEEARLQAIVDELYVQFVERVAAGRGMTADQARQYATGEVFTGAKAKEMGLVDQVGDYDDAVDMAASLGNTPRKTAHIRPPRSMRMRLLERFAVWAATGVLEEVEPLLSKRLWYM